MMLQVTAYVMRFAPFAVFGALANGDLQYLALIASEAKGIDVFGWVRNAFDQNYIELLLAGTGGNTGRYGRCT